MTTTNFPNALAFFWLASNDSPRQGYHDDPDDPGGGTLGGVTEATWATAIKRRLATGQLRNASDAQLTTVLRTLFWGPICNQLPRGIDILVFNGTGMTGQYPELLQQCLGFVGADVDGDIGPMTQAAVAGSDAPSLIDWLTGTHCAHLSGLPIWPRYGRGWVTRILAARDLALAHASLGAGASLTV